MLRLLAECLPCNLHPPPNSSSNSDLVERKGPSFNMGRFEVESSEVKMDAEPFAHGGGGDIYRGKYGHIDVALKRRVVESDAISNFDREVTMLSRLKHPNIIALYGIFHRGKDMYIILEYCGGLDLSAYYPSASFNLVEFSRIVHEILSAVAFMHYREISHRDIKPLNVFRVLFNYSYDQAEHIHTHFRYCFRLRHIP